MNSNELTPSKVCEVLKDLKADEDVDSLEGQALDYAIKHIDAIAKIQEGLVEKMKGSAGFGDYNLGKMQGLKEADLLVARVALCNNLESEE